VEGDRGGAARGDRDFLTVASFNSSGWGAAGVSAYLQDAFGNATGSAVAGPVTPDGSGQVVFTGLVDGTRYVASDGSRSVRFRTDPALPASAGTGGATLMPTAVKTGPYTAAVNDLAQVDASGSSRQVYDAVTTSGSATITSATAAFTAADVGKPISVLGFNPGATITAVNSATSITASANATSSGTSQVLTIGGPGSVAVTLPAGAAAGALVAVKKLDATAKQVLVTPSGGDTIDSVAAPLVIARRYAARRFRKDSATNWVVEDGYTPYPVPPPSGNIVDWIGDSISPQSSGVAIGNSSMNGSGKSDDYLWWAHLLSNARLLFGRPAGIGSTRSDQMLARLNDLALRETGHFCGIQTGTNDSSAGFSGATFAANIRAMVSIIQSSGRIPILCTPPPCPATSTFRFLDDEYRRFLVAYAKDNAFPLIDFYSLLVDPATGGYLAAYDSGDGTHPNTAGKKAMGQLLSDTLTAWLPPVRPPLEQANSTAAQLAANTGPSSTLLPNGLFLTDAAGATTITGWTKAGTQTFTVVANEAGIKGQSMRIQDAASSGFSQMSTGTLAGTATGRGGHRIAFGGLVKGNGTGVIGPNLQCQLSAPSGNILLRAMAVFGGAATPGWQQFYCEGTAPSDCNGISVTFSSSGGPNVDGQVAQLGVYDLTASGY
jgi:lysophospholipase L1-like esterase